MNQNKLNLIKHADNVYEIENFLTEEEQKILLSMTSDEGWITRGEGNIVKKIDQKYYTDINLRIKSFFKNVLSITDIGNIRRLRQGERMSQHIDAGNNESNPTPIVFGIAIYLNDDFTGGELYYKDLALAITPKPRSLVFHDAKLTHSVKTVKSGNRYSLTTFIIGNESTKFIGLDGQGI